MKIAILGGGISGLVTAYLLKKDRHDPVIIETSVRPGGAIRSSVDDDWLIEHGPNSLLETSPKITQLVNEVGLSSKKIYGNDAASNRYIVKNGKPVSLPTSPGAFLKTPLFSLSGKLGLLKEPFISSTSDEYESLASFVIRRLGPEFLDYAINPFVAGVYAGDPKKLSVKYAFKKLYELEENYGSLIKGQIKGARERKKRGTVAKNTAKMFSFENGLESLIRSLAKSLNHELQLQCSSLSVNKREREGFDVSYKKGGEDIHFKADRVVFSLPSHRYHSVATDLFDDHFYNTLEDIYYPPVSVLALGFRREQIQHPLDGFGMLIPEVERKSILGTLFSNSIFKGRAPEGHALLTNFIGGARQPEIAGKDTGELTDIAMKDLRELLGITGKPVISKHIHWPKAIPQYNVGYGKVYDAIYRMEKRSPGLHIHGNFRDGISLSDCIGTSFELAEKISISEDF